jgi:hypothetical protein
MCPLDCEYPNIGPFTQFFGEKLKMALNPSSLRRIIFSNL